MTLFTNPNFIDHIVKSQGADQVIDQQQYAAMQTLIEIETRLLMQTAIKFMRKDRRDTLNFEDIVSAARQNRHTDMALCAHNAVYQNKNEQIVRVDNTYSSPESYISEEMKMIGNFICDIPRFKGRWIYINGKIPAVSENSNLKSLHQLASNRSHQAEQEKKLLNEVKTEGSSYLTTQQKQYFLKTSQIIGSDIIPANGFVVEGDMTHLLPFFLSFIKKFLNQSALTFLLCILQSKYLNQSVEYHLNSILQILLAYKGPQSFDVGMAIANLIQLYYEKYPILLEIYDDSDEQDYSTVLKKLAFELHLGVSFDITLQFLEKCRRESQFNEQMAIICMRTLLAYSSKLKKFKQLIYDKIGASIYWLPCPQLRKDPYLGNL